MDSDTSLQASFWVMIVLQTLGSVDMPGSGQRKLPAPRAYLAPLVIYLVLQLLADTGHGRERAASVIGWVMVLTSLVQGPFGSRLVGLFNSVASIASSNVPTPTTESGSNES